MNSIVVPVYLNEDSIPSLIERLSALADGSRGLEVVMVVDGSPDGSFELLKDQLPNASFRSRLLLLSRNFGALKAIEAGLAAANGEQVAVMAADLQEPPELIPELFKAMDRDGADIAVGIRKERNDPFLQKAASEIFWWLYRAFVNRSIPRGGVDVFACSARVADRLAQNREANTSLVGLLYWYGYERVEVPYTRVSREHGKSAWTLKARMSYLMDSVFGFTDLPIRVLFVFGLLAFTAFLLLGVPVLVSRLSGTISVPGFATTILLILFFSALNALGLGVVGSYAWRAYENTKQRPHYVVADLMDFAPAGSENRYDE